MPTQRSRRIRNSRSLCPKYGATKQMVIQTFYNRWDVITTDLQQVFEFKTTLSSILETRRFPLLGWPNEGETRLPSSWNFHNKEWLSNLILVGHLIRHNSFARTIPLHYDGLCIQHFASKSILAQRLDRT
jgi:hypothetical protein